MKYLNPHEEEAATAEAEAAAWIARLHGPNRSAVVEREFALWLASSTANQAAFESATGIWNDVAGVSAATAFRSQPKPASIGRTPRIGRAAWCGMALTMGTLIVFGASFIRSSEPSFDTPVGEQRTVTLKDGSRVALNTNTHLTVSRRDDVRLVKLVSGEAFFEVAKDPAKPFIVDAGLEKITAIGTAFSVRRDGDEVTVTLVEGRVTVAKPPGNARGSTSRSNDEPERTLQLEAGERLVATATTERKMEAPSVEQATAWRRGEIVLDAIPISKAVAEMNRYSRVPIVLNDDAAGRLLISGIFKAGDSQAFADAVASVHGLRVVRHSTSIELVRQR